MLFPESEEIFGKGDSAASFYGRYFEICARILETGICFCMDSGMDNFFSEV